MSEDLWACPNCNGLITEDEYVNLPRTTKEGKYGPYPVIGGGPVE